MACTVCTKFYDNNTSKEVSDLTGAEMLINGVSVIGAEGGISTQENTNLIFSFDNKLPGSGGYTFNEWRYSTDGGNNFIPTSATNITVDATSLYYLEVRCYINPNTYKITYNYNNPSSIGDYEQDVFFNDENTQLAGAPSYQGYVFKGWRIGTELYAPLSIYTPTASDVTANGEWIVADDESLLPGEELTYEDEETGWTETVTLLKGVAAVLKAIGGSSSSSGSGGGSWSIGGSSKKAGSSYTPDSDEKKTAKATRATQKFWVRYSLSGGKNDASYNPVQIEDGQTVTLPAGPEKKGYTFISWKSSSGSNAYYSINDEVTIKKNTTFSAQYVTSVGYVTVKFSTDAGKGKIIVGENERKCKVEDVYSSCWDTGVSETKNFPTLEIQHDYYMFMGWYTSSNGGGNKIVESSKVLMPQNHTLFAYFIKGTTITAQGGGGTFSKGQSSKEFYAFVTSSAPESAPTITSCITESPVRTGWEGQREGWAFKNGNLLTDSDKVTSNGQNITIYAKWKQRVVFATDKSGETISDIFVTHGEKYQTLPTASDLDNKKFFGWFDSKTGGTRYTTNSTCAKTAGDKLTLYAQYATTKQKVTFDLVYTSSNPPSPMYFGIPGKYTGLPNPPDERTGYTFLGWFDSKSGGNQITGSTDVSDATERTLYAQWNGQQHVHFYGELFRFDDGSTIQHKYYDKGGTYYDFPKPNTGKSNVPSSSGSNNYIGYTFKYYTTSQTGGNKVEEGDTVSDADELWLYAQYDQNTTEYTMTFDATSEGTCGTSATDRYEGQQVGSLPIAIYSGSSSSSLSTSKRDTENPKSFAGWKVNETIIDSSYVMTENVTAVAQWVDKILLYYAVDANTPPPHIPSEG